MYTCVRQNVCVYVSLYVRICIDVSVCVLVLSCTCLSPEFGSWHRLVVPYLKSLSMIVNFVNNKNFNLKLNPYLL